MNISVSYSSPITKNWSLNISWFNDAWPKCHQKKSLLLPYNVLANCIIKLMDTKQIIFSEKEGDLLLRWMIVNVKTAQSCPTLCNPMDFPWNSLNQNTGVGSLSLLQGIFPTQGPNPGFPHCRQILYQLSHKGSPRILEWVAYPFSSGSSQPWGQTGVSCIAGGFFTSWAIREALYLFWGKGIQLENILTELICRPKMIANGPKVL